eukprot:3960109-Pleurochrysis_carterae.AAC.1
MPCFAMVRFVSDTLSFVSDPRAAVCACETLRQAKFVCSALFLFALLRMSANARLRRFCPVRHLLSGDQALKSLFLALSQLGFLAARICPSCDSTSSDCTSR